MSHDCTAMDAALCRRLPGRHAASRGCRAWRLPPPPHAPVAARIPPRRPAQACPDRLRTPSPVAKNLASAEWLFQISGRRKIGEQEAGLRNVEASRNLQQTQGRCSANAQEAQGRCRRCAGDFARRFAHTLHTTHYTYTGFCRGLRPYFCACSAPRWSGRLAGGLPGAVRRSLPPQGRHEGGARRARPRAWVTRRRLGGADRCRHRLCGQDRRSPLVQPQDLARTGALE